MKIFSENITEKFAHYAADQKIYNDIYNLIESSLKANVDGNVSENASIIGKEELVKELSKLVENEITKSKIKILEEYKQKPAIIQEKVDTTDPLLKLVNDAKETKICDCKGECKCGTTEEVCEKCEKTPCECNK